MAISRKNLVKFTTRHLAAAFMILALTWLVRPFRDFLAPQIIVLLYLLPIMLTTVLWGLTPGILSSFLAFLAFNYYFIEPLHTLQVHATQDLIALIIFLVIAVVMSQLIGQARAGIRIARLREWEATRMYELISSLAGLHEVQSIAESLAAHVKNTLDCDTVEVAIPSNRSETAYSVVLPPSARRDEAPTARVNLRTSRGSEGEMCVWRTEKDFSPEEQRLWEAFSTQAALALERVRLSKSENKSRILEESDRLKTSLLNSVSHELRSPLAAIKASISSLRTGAVDWNSSARQELLETVEEETDHLNQLVGNLLDMSRIDSGALKPLLRWASAAEIARGVAAKMRKQLESHVLQMDMDDTLPLIPVDYVMMEQVFTNLFSNSAKYAPAGTRIQVLGAKEISYLHIQVINQGPVVPEAQLERIFDKFNRITESDRITGTGLGLSICKGIVEAHNGKIWAENQASGVAFHILLPLSIDGSLPVPPKEAENG